MRHPASKLTNPASDEADFANSATSDDGLVPHSGPFTLSEVGTVLDRLVTRRSAEGPGGSRGLAVPGPWRAPAVTAIGLRGFRTDGGTAGWPDEYWWGRS